MLCRQEALNGDDTDPGSVYEWVYVVREGVCHSMIFSCGNTANAIWHPQIAKLNYTKAVSKISPYFLPRAQFTYCHSIGIQKKKCKIDAICSAIACALGMPNGLV